MSAKKKWLIGLAAVLLTAVLGVLGWYLYDNNVDRSGWREKDGAYLYWDFHAKPVTGWQDLEGKRYFFGADGIMLTHWQQIEGKQYYFGRDGALDLGWLDIEGKRYRTDDTGVILTGWQDVEGSRYYLDETGVVQTRWQTLSGNRYYFGESGAMATAWQDIDGSRYWFDSNGIMVTEALELEDGIFYFDAEGRLVTGWYQVEDRRYYAHPDTGCRAVGWVEIAGSRHCFGEDGAMVTGWAADGEYSYYLGQDGTPVTGKQEIDGQIHYFSPKGVHIILVNARNKVPEYYEPNLVSIQAGHKVDASCNDALQQMLADCKAAAGYYEFNSSYRSIYDQQWILEARTQENMVDGRGYAAARAIALQTVAIPGTSEHHLGLAVDILGSKAIAWLTEHCWEYGFIVRYQGEKSHITGIVNEPWHYRYVGVEVALDIRESGMCLEEYVGEYIPEPEAAPETEE